MTSLQILVVDDEPAIRQILAASLGRAGHTVELAGGGQEALGRLAKGDIDLVLCDINMPDLSGIEVVRQARAAAIDATFIMITAYSSLDTAIEAMKAGAFDYMIKPLRTEEIVQRLVAGRRPARPAGREPHPAEPGRERRRGGVPARVGGDAGGRAPGEQGRARPTAPCSSPARAAPARASSRKLVHQRSERAAGPFIAVNCGAIPENLIESEFFGHVKGAFTGADRARKGLFLEADRGTLFLDEIGELPLALQVKLLHVLESKEVRPVGGEQARRTNARIVAATNRDLRRWRRRGQVPRGPVLPPQRLPDRGAAAARAQGGRRRAARLPARPHRQAAGHPPQALARSGCAGGAARLRLARQRARGRERAGPRRHPRRGRPHLARRPAGRSHAGDGASRRRCADRARRQPARPGAPLRAVGDSTCDRRGRRGSPCRRAQPRHRAVEPVSQARGRGCGHLGRARRRGRRRLARGAPS